MGYIKEPKGVDFLVEPTKLTIDDIRAIRSAISNYRQTNTAMPVEAISQCNGKSAKTVKMKSKQKAI